MKTPFITSIIEKVAEEIGAVVVVEPEYRYVGYIKFKNGNRTFFRNYRFNINYHASAEIIKDKDYTKFFLKEFGYKTTEGKTFFTEQFCQAINSNRNIEVGFDYAQELGFPVIVKPLNLTHGILVTKVYTKEEYYKVAQKILQNNYALIIERFYSGNDYRILVLDDEIVVAYQRIPLLIKGDGKSTVLELMQQKQENFITNDRGKIIKFEDERIQTNLQRLNFNFNTILPKDKIVYLLDNANLSSGGEAIDLTESIHPDFKKLAINVTKDMGMRLAGVDIITNDITSPMVDYTIIEVNGSPGLDHYASLGEAQHKRVENLYLKVLKALENQ
ncbi:cyanophycin synthetase [Nostoc sp. UHCC 0302]|uniref:cyanophycin synthetase n=1 Tax=Nostoc sp. UHCC 0302 TaxID=3134896 RepID=UPI00311CC3EB